MKKRNLVEVKPEDLKFLRTVQEALGGIPLAQAVSFVIKKAQPGLEAKLAPLMSDEDAA